MSNKKKHRSRTDRWTTPPEHARPEKREAGGGAFDEDDDDEDLGVLDDEDWEEEDDDEEAEEGWRDESTSYAVSANGLRRRYPRRPGARPSPERWGAVESFDEDQDG